MDSYSTRTHVEEKLTIYCPQSLEPQQSTQVIPKGNLIMCNNISVLIIHSKSFNDIEKVKVNAYQNVGHFIGHIFCNQSDFIRLQVLCVTSNRRIQSNNI